MDSWRVIYHPAGDAAWNMAVDEALLRSYMSGSSSPTIRFYGWECPSISLGRFQSFAASLDPSHCRSQGITVVRRPTGGRAVLHGTDLTFSIIQPNPGSSVKESYRNLSIAVHQALICAGAPVELFLDASDASRMRSVANCFDLKASFEIALHGRKVLGCAQLRKETAILQQNSLLLEPPSADNLSAFVNRLGAENGPCLVHYAREELILACICDQIEQMFDCNLIASGITSEEDSCARDLLDSKYGTHEWNLEAASVVE